MLDGQGLVGTVTAVNAQTCTVLLATDATSVVGVTLASSGQIGWVTGPGKTRSGSGLLRLQVLDANADLSPGEQLVTSASVHDRPYVPGVPVGVISQVENRAGSLTALALVRPYVDFTSLGVVGIVVVPPTHNPRFSVLPPAPARQAGAHGDRHRDSRAVGPADPVEAAEVRRAILSAVLLAIALMLQLTVVNRLPLPGAGGPDLVLLTVVALGLCSGPAAGAVTGFCAGLASTSRRRAAT